MAIVCYLVIFYSKKDVLEITDIILHYHYRTNNMLKRKYRKLSIKFHHVGKFFIPIIFVNFVR